MPHSRQARIAVVSTPHVLRVHPEADMRRLLDPTTPRAWPSQAQRAKTPLLAWCDIFATLKDRYPTFSRPSRAREIAVSARAASEIAQSPFHYRKSASANCISARWITLMPTTQDKLGLSCSSVGLSTPRASSRHAEADASRLLDPTMPRARPSHTDSARRPRSRRWLDVTGRYRTCRDMRYRTRPIRPPLQTRLHAVCRGRIAASPKKARRAKGTQPPMSG
jgi:hypothetical protein